LSENLNGRYSLGDVGTDGRIQLKLILKENDVMMWIELIWLRIGPMTGSCESGNEISGSIMVRNLWNS
jgi:hypothetical protein